jgi:DNA repair protein RecN (Recombination protein N)
MLRYLRIRNLAVIESVAVEFEPGLNILTGETGAGKSILVEAVGLLLGGRASSDLVRTGEQIAEIDAVFEHDGRETCVRREITAQGRSRAFVDDSLATAAGLRELASGLIELHGQHEHQVLTDPQTHLDLLDTYARHGDLRDRVAAAFFAVEAARRHLDALRLDERQKLARMDLLTYQRDEIARVNPQPGEDEQLASTKLVLANAERLRRLSAEAYDALYESDQAALSALTTVWKRVADLATLDSRATPFLDSRDAIKSQLEDLAFFLRTYADDLPAGPDALQEVEDRLALLDRLKRKYGPSLDDVRRHLESANRELNDLAALDDSIASATAVLEQATTAYLDVARTLSAARRRAALRFSTALAESLAELGMAGSRFEVRFEDAPGESGWSSRGIDAAEFLVSANPGEDLRPLARIASGGELSRIMLAIRTLSRAAGARTLIFDEVDAGIGGRAADDVGRKLRFLGREAQVLCITHLPQIAAYGQSHFQVAKRIAAGRTVTEVHRLDDGPRAEELARMMAGSVVSDSVLETARQLLASRAKGEQGAKGESETSEIPPVSPPLKAAASGRGAPARGRK